MALRDILLAEFDHEMAATRRLLACVPQTALAWRPHDRARTMGELAAHVVEVLGWTAHVLDAASFDLDAAPAPAPPALSTTTLLEQFADAARLARTCVDRTDGELNAVWSLKQGGQELFSLPRAAAFRMLVLGHVVHHRGQLSVYLRMNDVPVPSLYGPSGDFNRAK